MVTATPRPVLRPSFTCRPAPRPTPTRTPTAIPSTPTPIPPTPTPTVVPSRPTTPAVEQPCEMRPRAAEWDVAWYESPEKDSPGELLGTETKSPNFSFYAAWFWGDSVFAGRRDYTRMDATMTMVPQLTGLVRFYLHGDDSFRLYLDDDPDPIVDRWRTHSSYNLERVEEWVKLPKGVHQLRIEYWNKKGNAVLVFGMDEHLLSWFEASDCEGIRNELPEQLYFTYRPQSESLPDVAERFQLQLSELQFANPQIPNPYAAFTGELLLVPGNRPVENRKIVLVQGITSSSNPEQYVDHKDSGARRALVLHFVQKYSILEASSNRGNVFLMSRML